ncbi:DUF6146 family protein [Flagellimonas sp. DF-77]|uniref:DUF6146 family protein n=1 Tax=Flagellimonas algarum TaxID=3230298 RepID=UPI003396E612
MGVLSGLAQELEISAEEQAIFEGEADDTTETAETESEYDIVIIDIGFNRWLNQIAQPKGYYSQRFLEQRNYLYVLEWNRRFLEPQRFDPLLYEVNINYDPEIDYGYDVNYQLYNYFIYFQRRYNQRLGPFLPRI